MISSIDDQSSNTVHDTPNSQPLSQPTINCDSVPNYSESHRQSPHAYRTNTLIPSVDTVLSYAQSVFPQSVLPDQLSALHVVNPTIGTSDSYFETPHHYICEQMPQEAYSMNNVSQPRTTINLNHFISQ